jgi:endonuclease-3
MRPPDLKADKELSERIGKILDLLMGKYGLPERQPHQDPVSVLVQTILSQNTSDTNSGSAFRALTSTFDSWEEVARADVNAIAHLIKSGGLGQIKARRIKQALDEIIRERGKLELDFLSSLTPYNAEEWLLRLPGVGLKTARCVLLFSLDMPAFPVDTHILRVTRRLELINPRASLLEAHNVLGQAVAPEDVYNFHVLVIEHGRRVCRAQKPDCPNCVLNRLCLYYTKISG